MFSPPVVSGHVLSPTRSSPATSPTTSTSRGSRLRSLSYLKNYAHHLTGRDNNTASSSSSNTAFTNHGNNPSLANRHAAATSPATSSATIPAAPNTATAVPTPPASATTIDLSSSSHLSPSHPHSPTSASAALLSPSASSLSASHRISRSISNPLHGSIAANTAASTTITNATSVQQQQQQQQRPDHTENSSTSGVTTATSVSPATASAAPAVSTPGTIHLLSRVVSVPSTSSGPALQSVVESDVESPIFVSANPSPSASVAAMESIPEPAAAAVSAAANDTAPAPATAAPGSSTDASPSSHYSIRLTAYTDPRSTRQSLEFSTVLRKLPTGNEVLRVGRHSERENGRAVPSNVPSAAPIGFKSKVVSRRHCEFWCDEGKWYIKDVKSSSGTFLNHVRLSPPGQESKPWRVKDGDIIQLGIDFRGGEETMFRCVKMRVEVNRGWQNSANPFNTSAHERIRNLAKPNASSNSQDCTICLSRIACIKALLDGPSYPLFHCPNCRATTDLEAEPEEPEGWEMVDDAPATADETTMSTAPTGVAPVAAVGAQLDGASSSNLDAAVTIPISTLAAAAAAAATANATVAIAAADDRILQAPAAATDANGDVTMVLPAGALQSLNIDEQQLAEIQEEQGEAQLSNAATPALSDVPASAPASIASAGVPIPSPRTPSPGSQTGQDQVLTPRNHAGPWVFDGQALDASHGLTPLTSAMSDSGSGPMEVS
ncbi:E3 ubiquitin-protein ligase DMA2 [Ceratocystis lukuohia]|uniref:E3 ubiquitin-protein ligase DMA2 n=1 Tax=Ceratocystis lukuohia TaxID=2019550 RepID=A0ABR4MJE0_9PEZI